MMWLFKEEESNVSVKVVGKVSWLGPILVLYTETTWIELPLERNICGVFDSLLNLCMINLAWYLYIELSYHKIAYGTIEGDLLLMKWRRLPRHLHCQVLCPSNVVAWSASNNCKALVTLLTVLLLYWLVSSDLPNRRQLKIWMSFLEEWMRMQQKCLRWWIE